MSETATVVPQLTVETQLIDADTALLEVVDARHPLVFLRRGDGVVGIGETIRLEFSGPSRFVDAAETWRAITAAAVVSDDVRRPGSGLVAFGAFAFDDHSACTSVLIVPEVILGRRGGTTWITHINGSTRAATRTPFGRPFRVPMHEGAMSSKRYTAAVASAIEAIESGLLRKVVLARDLVGILPSDSDIRRILAALTVDYPDTWTFSVDGLVGSSPETLVRVTSGAVTARVLAGSIARGVDADADRLAAESLSRSVKDRDEHRFAVDSVLASLEPLSRSATASAEPFTLQLPNLWHLASDVAGELDDWSSSLDLLAVLHPTAAVAGEPTRAALDFIAAREPFDRERYAGPVGWVDGDGDGVWAIALRSAEISIAGRVRAFAGAGVVAGSDPEAELAETALKFRPITGALD